MSIGLYDIYFCEANGLPELRLIKEMTGSQEVEYSTDEIVKLLDNNFSFSEMRNEHAYIVCMDTFNHIKCVGVLGVGSHDEVNTDAKTVGAYLLLSGADRYAILHNHPNNDTEPSEEDLIECNCIKGMSLIFNIEMYEYIIVSRIGWHGIINGTFEYY